MPRKSLPPEAYIAVNNNLPCLNPNCKEHGAPHVGCKCYSRSGGFTARTPSQLGTGEIGAHHFSENFAEGGTVCAQHLPHHPDCPYFVDGGQVENNQIFNDNPHLAVDHAVANHGLHHLLTKTGHSKSEAPHRPAMEFADHAKRGHHRMKAHVHGMFDKKMPEMEHDHESIQALKNHVDDLHANPDKILNMGGNMGDALPDHSGIMANKASIATEYLHSLKPLGNQMSPFDKVTPPSKMEESAYNRQLKIAQQPLSILSHIRQGTVNPSDLQTLRTLYPELSKSIMDKTFEKVAEAKGNGSLIPYKHKMGLSALLGPLDSTQTPQAMQAIIKSAAGKTETNQGSSKGPTAQTQKTIEKSNQMYQTNLDSLQINRKS